MKFDRSSFKPTTLASLLKEEERVVTQKQSMKGEKVESLKLSEGMNRLRIYPAHPDENNPNPKSIINAVEYYLPIKLDKWENNRVVKDSSGQNVSEIRNGAIKDARTHGWDYKTNNYPKRDLVDEYIKYVVALADASCTTIDEKTDFLKPIMGGKFGDPIQGILPKTKWVFYADLYDENNDKKFGKFKFSQKTIHNGIIKAAEQESANQPLQTSLDCFTNPDDGRLLKIVWDKENPDAKLKYNATIDTSQKQIIVEGKALKVLTSYPISDEDLDYFVNNIPSLEKEYRRTFDFKEIEKQLEGLKNFDAQNEYGVFQDDAFLDIVEELYNFWLEAPDQNPTESKVEEVQVQTQVYKPKVAPKKEVIEVVEEDNSADLTEEDEIDNNENPFVMEAEQTIVATKTAPALSAKDRIAALRNKTNSVR